MNSNVGTNICSTSTYFNIQKNYIFYLIICQKMERDFRNILITVYSSVNNFNTYIYNFI